MLYKGLVNSILRVRTGDREGTWGQKGTLNREVAGVQAASLLSLKVILAAKGPHFTWAKRASVQTWGMVCCLLFGITTWVVGKEDPLDKRDLSSGAVPVIFRAGATGFNLAGNLRNILPDPKPNLVKEEILNHSGENTKPLGFLIQIWSPCFLKQ